MNISTVRFQFKWLIRFYCVSFYTTPLHSYFHRKYKNKTRNFKFEKNVQSKHISLSSDILIKKVLE